VRPRESRPVEQAIASELGVPRSSIVGWVLHSEAQTGYAAPGMIKNEMQVTLQITSRAVVDKLHALANSERSTVRVMHLSRPEFAFDGGTWGLDIMLLYGKATQRIFTALARALVYKKIRRKR
jgi:hypothetical protein